uniref:G-protein coupled receptors family 1 profile domain-containing protein n=1 Tax=Meloidogyne javanica TaxID=6303 RepID=A0A915MD55_MELJA
MLAILIYSALSIVAFVGNALILAVFLRFKRLRTPTNMLIANLALGDLMISIFCIPLSYWHVLATAVFVSSWTLVAISFDRFMAIQFSMSPWLKMNRKRALYATLITWGFSLIMALPLLVVNQLESSSEGVDTCLEKWNDFFSDSFVSLYTSSLFALQYCLPLSVLLITYTAIGFSALYAVCWLPQNLLMNIWVTYDSSALNYPYILYIWWGAHTLAMFHSIVNPFVYYATNRRIHAALKHLLRWLPCLQNARNVALAEFDQTARQKAVTNSFKYPVGDSRRLTLHTQKTISLSMD